MMADLEGYKPAEVPVEQLAKFEPVINLETPPQTGLTIPKNVVAGLIGTRI